jgi:predicted ATPase
MHTSAVYDFIKILHKLVALGVQVIMTTHSPTTFNLIDEENLFHVFKDENRKLKIEKEEKNYGILKSFDGETIIGNLLGPGKSKIASNLNLFKDIIWEHITKFSVITGKNGVGKSRFLNIIKRIHPSSLFINFELNFNQKLELDMSFNQYIHRIGAYMEGKNDYFGHPEILSYDKIIKFLQESSENYRAKRVFHEQFFYRSAIVKACLDKLQKFLTNFIGILTIALYLENTSKLNEYLKSKRYKYVISVKQRIFLQINPMENPKQEIEKSIPEIDIDTNVFFELESQKSNDNISFNYVQLSSGERTMLHLYLWEYLMKHFMSSIEPTQIVMLDEPDSHLHPSKTND